MVTAQYDGIVSLHIFRSAQTHHTWLAWRFYICVKSDAFKKKLLTSFCYLFFESFPLWKWGKLIAVAGMVSTISAPIF